MDPINTTEKKIAATYKIICGWIPLFFFFSSELLSKLRNDRNYYSFSSSCNSTQ